MSVLHSVGPRSTGSDSQSNETFLQHFYLIAVFAIVLALLILRVIILRRRNRGLSDFFRIRGSNSQYSYGSYPPHDSNYGSVLHGIQLAPPPAAYRPDRRVHAADVDAHGRRLGPAGEEWDGKDTLPAYDNLDRPPKYVEAGWSEGSRPPAVGQSAAAAVPATEGGQSRVSQPNTANGTSWDHVCQPPDDTHGVAGVAHGNGTPLSPPAHNDLSHS